LTGLPHTAFYCALRRCPARSNLTRLADACFTVLFTALPVRTDPTGLADTMLHRAFCCSSSPDGFDRTGGHHVLSRFTLLPSPDEFDRTARPRDLLHFRCGPVRTDSTGLADTMFYRALRCCPVRTDWTGLPDPVSYCDFRRGPVRTDSTGLAAPVLYRVFRCSSNADEFERTAGPNVLLCFLKLSQCGRIRPDYQTLCFTVLYAALPVRTNSTGLPDSVFYHAFCGSADPHAFDRVARARI
jgi:hypothetical protein